jgi:hypothetical protein
MVVADRSELYPVQERPTALAGWVDPNASHSHAEVPKHQSVACLVVRQ